MILFFFLMNRVGAPQGYIPGLINLCYVKSFNWDLSSIIYLKEIWYINIYIWISLISRFISWSTFLNGGRSIKSLGKIPSYSLNDFSSFLIAIFTFSFILIMNNYSLLLRYFLSLKFDNRWIFGLWGSALISAMYYKGLFNCHMIHEIFSISIIE